MKERVFWEKGIRRVLSLMFCLAVCLILIPMTASAAEGDAKVITEINLLCPETVYENEKDFQATISETSYVASNLEGAIRINDSYWEETATGKMATEVVAGHKYRLVFQLSTRYECLFQEKSANPGEFGGVVKHNGKMIAADTKLDNSTGRLAIYTKEITAQPDYFTKQPVGGIGEVGKPFTITFGTLTNTEEISLMREEDNGWWTEDVLAPGTTSCDIPFPSTSEPVRFRLRVFTAGGNLLLSDAFEITWVNDYFINKPAYGSAKAGETYTITFEHRFTDLPVVLATGEDTDHLLYLSAAEQGTNFIDIPYTSKKLGRSERYWLVIMGGGGPGVNVYSTPFDITWYDNFEIQPAGGVSEVGKPYTITFAHYVTDCGLFLEKYNKRTGFWEKVAEFPPEDRITYDIPYGTPGETDKYRITVDYAVVSVEGDISACDLHSDEFEVTWRKEGVLPKIPKENLVTVPENLSAGSRLAVNEKVIGTSDDMMMGYLSGYVTWVYTSAAGEVSTYRFNRDYEYFTVAKNMYHGSVHCEVYNDNEDAAWVSQEVSFDNVHDFSVQSASGLKCSVCGLLGSFEQPVISSLSSNATGVQITWGAVDGVTQYRVFYKTATGAWTTFANVKGTSTTVTGLKSGTAYSFLVRCLSADGKSYTDTYDTAKSKSLTYIAQPAVASLSNTSTGVEVKWNAVGGAAQYRVFYKAGSGAWTGFGNTKGTSLVVTGLTAGKTYSFTVRCVSADGKTYTSTYDTTGKSIVYQPAASTMLAKPEITALSSNSAGVQVTWGAVSGAAQYRVFYKTATGAWTAFANVKGTSTTVTGLTSGTTYTFLVRCLSEDAKSYTSDYDAAKSKSHTYIAQPAVSSLSNTSIGVEVKWNAVPGAAQYRVFYKAAGGAWTGFNNTTATSLVVIGLDEGTTYSFTVRCVSADGKSYTSTYDAIGKSIIYQPTTNTMLAKPEITALSSNSAGVQITWGAVSGAAQYRVFYKTATGAWTAYGNTNATSMVVTGLTSGTTYSFLVRCLSADGKAYTSDYDAAKSKSHTYIAQPAVSSVTNTSTGVQVKWNAVGGAAQYRVFYKAAGGAWTGYKNTTGTGMVVTGLTKGTTYSFTVRCVSADGKNYTSTYDTTGKSIKYE